MRRYVEPLLAWAFLVVWLSPLIALLGDLACWFFVAHQCSSIYWQEAAYLRPWIVLLWTVIFPILAAMLAGLFA